MEIYSTSDQMDKALESLKQYIELTGEESLYETVADVYAELGNSEAALSAYQRYLDGIEMTEADRDFLLGTYLMNMGNYAEAAECFETLTGDETYGTASMFNLGICCIQTGSAEKALAWFTSCREAGGTYSGMEYNTGLCHMMLEQWEDAEKAFAHSISVPEEEFAAMARFNTGLIRMQAERYEEAIASFNEIGDAIAEIPETYFYRAACEGAAGKLEEALADYTKCIELGLDKSQCYYQRAQIYAALGDEEHRLEDLTKSIEIQ